MYAGVHQGDRLVALGFAVVAILAASLGLLGDGTGHGGAAVPQQIGQMHEPENLPPPSRPPPAQLPEADRQIAKFLMEREPEFLALEFGGVRWGEKDEDEMSPAKVISVLQRMRSSPQMDRLTINDICYLVSQFYAISIATTEAGGAHLNGNDAELKAGVETLLKKLRERAQAIHVVAINQSSQRVSLLLQGEAQLLTRARQSFPYQWLGACEIRSGGQLTLMREDPETQLALPIKVASLDVKDPARLEFPGDRLYVKWSLSPKTGELGLIVYDLSVKGR